jgi:Fur family transcriptional regulator, ferric uptake regulator
MCMAKKMKTGEAAVFSVYLKKNGLNETKQRSSILNEFVKIEKHVSAEDLFVAVYKKHPSIGQATVFRTLKVLVDAGLAEPVELMDKTVRYEHKLRHDHHDHLICTVCGKIVEFFDDRIEALQNTVCKKEGYLMDRHRLEIFGVCPSCQRRKQK